MFGIGWSELAVILCVAIIFIHPKDLPALFRKLGRLYSKVKKMYAEIVATKDQFVKDIEEAAALEEKKEAQEAAATAGAATVGTAAAGATSAAATVAAAPESSAQPGTPPAADLGADLSAEPNAAPIAEPSESSPYIHPSSVE